MYFYNNNNNNDNNNKKIILDELFMLSCQWNYCAGYCQTGTSESKCNAAETNGVRLLHGKMASFENNKQPMFRAMYKAFAGVILKVNFYHSLRKNQQTTN